MTLQQLRYVIAVADHGSMNEAAKALFISQPSLSGAVKELEKELGFELFLRTSRGIVVTPDGEEFLGYARQVTEQYRLLRNRYIAALFLCGKGICRDSQTCGDGKLRICCI